jgi:glycosyltransferase involved in cell wall biosynthesis
MSRPAAVVLSPEAPYPMHGGGAVRTASLLQYLSRRYDLDLILFRQHGDSDPALSLPPGLVRRADTVTLPFHSKRPTAWAVRNTRRWLRGAPPLLDRFAGQEAALASILEGRRYDVGIIEHFWCAPYVEQLAGACGRTVLDLHNVESELHASCARSAHWPFSVAHQRFSRAYIREEKHWLPRFSDLIATSAEDAVRLRRLAPQSPVAVYRNALPLIPVPQTSTDEVIAFSGNFEYHPNMEAVRFLARQIWPALADRFPALRLRLIGKNPGAIAAAIRGIPRIDTTGPVEDAVAELARARVAIVPLLSGSGTRLKILEAWAAARPVVSTAIGAEGLGASPGTELLIADSPQAFCASVAGLLGSEEMRMRIGCAGRQKYEREYTWETVWPSLPL